jgi:peptidoglycan/xylan/chitin deacetylase (PgdA/CDA1 family)
MNRGASRLVQRVLGPIGVLVVMAAVGACAANLGAATSGEIVLAPLVADTPDAAATISASLRAALPHGEPVMPPPDMTLPASGQGAEANPREEPAAGSLSLLPTATPTPAQAPTATPVPTPTSTPAPALEPTPDGVQRTVSVPILMYHYISTPPAGADAYRIDLSTSPEQFAAQLDRLLAEGYTTISLYQLLAHLAQGAPLPAKPVVLTFDDGYRDNYEHAFPLLRERGMTATFFVVTDFIDEERPLYLSWDMAREMLAGGMSIESHGRNHFTLEGQDDNYLVWQALGSLETLQYELGVRPRFVSYPAGDYDQRTIAIFHSANYWAGVTTVQGTEQSSARPFELERIRVRNTTTPDALIRFMEADW